MKRKNKCLNIFCRYSINIYIDHYSAKKYIHLSACKKNSQCSSDILLFEKRLELQIILHCKCFPFRIQCRRFFPFRETELKIPRPNLDQILVGFATNIRLILIQMLLTIIHPSFFFLCSLVFYHFNVHLTSYNLMNFFFSLSLSLFFPLK